MPRPSSHVIESAANPATSDNVAAYSVIVAVSLLLRQIESLHDRVEYRIACRPELPGDGPQDHGAISGGVRGEGSPDVSE
jgi:hypothetical protein